MKNKYFRMGLMACTAVSVVSLQSGMAYAQDAATASATDLQTITVKTTKKTARQKLEKGAADTPLATETTAEQIKNRQITSLEDMGNTTEPGVSYSTERNSINIRGLEDDRILTAIDGIRIPFLPDYARTATGGVNSFDFSSLATVDVVRGGDSSRGGSGMLGGAILLRTLEPDDLITEGRDWGGEVRTTLDSKDRSLQGSLAVAKRIGNTSVLFQGSYARGHEKDNNGSVGGIGVTRSEANPMDFNKSNLMGKLRHEIEGGHTIGISAERYDYSSTADLQAAQGATYRQGDWWGIDDVRRERVSLDYSYEAIGSDSWIDAARASLYYQRLKREDGNDGYRLTTPIGDYARISDNQDKTFGLNGSASSSFETGGLSHEVRFGGEVSRTRTSQYLSGVDSCPAVPPSPFHACNFHHINQSDMPVVNAWRVGLFAEDTITFGESNFSLTPGLRFDYYDYSPQASAGWTANSGFSGVPDGVDDFRVSPKLRAEYELNPQVQLFAQWAMGFKAPNVSELYLDYAKSSGTPTYQVIGNPALKTETSHGFEVGAKLGDEDFGGRLTAFHNSYRNFIDMVSITPSPDPAFATTQRWSNINRVRISGVELSGHKQFENGFNVRASLVYNYGKNLDTGKLLDSVAPLKGIVGAGYAAETWGVDASWVGVAGVSSKSEAVFKAPGYGIVNLAAWWTPEQFEGLRIQAGVYNVLDKTYFDALNWRDINVAAATSQPRDYYSESGRTFKLSLTKKF